MTEAAFEALRPIFQPLVERLVAMNPMSLTEVPKEKGLYALREGDRYVYVGIGGNLRRRCIQHRSGRLSATLAIKLARLATSSAPTYRANGSLKTLLKDRSFIDAFRSARSRIAEMEIRFVDTITDDDDLAIFERPIAKPHIL